MGVTVGLTNKFLITVCDVRAHVYTCIYTCTCIYMYLYMYMYMLCIYTCTCICVVFISRRVAVPVSLMGNYRSDIRDCSLKVLFLGIPGFHPSHSYDTVEVSKVQ